jgi:hypothetical protein
MRRALAPFIAAALVLVIAAQSATAAQVIQRTWRASIGTGGAHGSATLVGYTDDTGTLDVNLIGMQANKSYTVQLYAGTCTSLKTKLGSWAKYATDGSGAYTGSKHLSSITMNKVWYYGRPGTLAIRFVTGSAVTCAGLGYFHATRVYIPSYKINMPVVPGPNGYPYCNVAMYQRILWQPNEPGVSFIYAHARTGMFLPLLNASKISNGAAMIGKLVYVYTSDSKMYTYKISSVRRHVKSIQAAVGVTYETLWLQTSEGPNFTYPKLVITAKRIAVTSVSYATAHPKPHIVKCG